jgi:hypothetical protein
MTDLIALVRGLIGDNGTPKVFTDDEIESGLDLRRDYVFKEVLTAYPAPDGSQLKFQSSYRYWESDIELTDPAGTALEPDKSDPMSGYFTFAESQDVVYATGFAYDVYAAAGELLTIWAGRIEQDITRFSADGSSFEFAGLRDSKLKLAAEYKAKSRTFGSVQTVRIVRDDINY